MFLLAHKCFDTIKAKHSSFYHIMEDAKSNGIDASLLCSNQVEADKLLISHALRVFFQIAGKITILTLFIYSPAQIFILET